MGKTNAELVVAAFPSDDRFNPYLSLLYGGLEREGVKSAVEPRWRMGWLLANRDKVDILHLHWLDHLHRKGLLGVSLFLLRFAVARILDYKIVWTMHNYLPHERNGRLERLITRAMGRRAHAVIAHCRHGQWVAEKFFRRRMHVYAVPHGNYVGVYPNRIAREEARKHLHLPEDALVYLYFGQVRSYKGLADLTKGFGQIDSPKARLVIAGRLVGEGCRQELEQAAHTDQRISLHFGFVEDGDVQVYFNSADVVVLPYVDVLTSGTVILALSFGKPVIVPRAGCLPEVVGSEAGLIYDGPQAASLAAALQAAETMDRPAASQAASRRAAELDWASVARQHRQIYQRVLTRASFQAGEPASG